MTWKKTIFRLAALLLSWAAASPCQAKGQPSLKLATLSAERKLELSADRLSYQPDRQTIVLEGKVKLGSDQLKVNAAKVTVRVDKKGNPVRVIAKGNVSFSFGKSKGRAGTLEVMPRQNRLEISGDPRLRWAPLGLVLRGERILVDLSRGMFTVHRARVKMGQRTDHRPSASLPGARTVAPTAKARKNR